MDTQIKQSGSSVTADVRADRGLDGELKLDHLLEQDGVHYISEEC